MTVPAIQPQISSVAPVDSGFELDGHLLSLIAGGEAGAPAEPEPIGGTGRLRAAHYRQFLDALGVAMYTTDAAGRITFFNAAAADFWGRRPALGEEWCGSLSLLWPDEVPMRHDQCPMAIALKEQRPVRGGEAIAVRPDGTRVRFVPYPTPLFDDDGRLIGAVNVLVDVTERHRAEEDSRVATRALAASNAVKDEFLGLVSHELRTPVTTIYGNARLLEARGAELDESVKASMLADMAADADRLHSIIENLLHLTRLGSSAPFELEPQVLDRLVERTVRSFQARHPSREINLLVSGHGAVVQAEETYLALLVENLMSNADKYSPQETPIEVRVTVVGDEAVVLIADRGIGFGETPPERLFEPFYRSQEAKSAANGLGIGLALCQRVVLALGGRIWASPRQGGGAEIGFALPHQWGPDDLA
jgi:PAS domain S-box-containing protein